MSTAEETPEGFYLGEDGEWVPEGWDESALGENCHNISTGPFGSSLHASDYVIEGIPSIMPQNIVNGRISEDGIAKITEFDANRLKKHRVQIGDVVFSRRGDIEKCALISEREEGWLCGTGCLQIQFENPENSMEFVFLQLSSPQTSRWLYSNCVGATMPNLNTGILKRVPLLLPPLPEQKAIAAVLGSLDDKIELLREQNETLEALAQTLFKRWFIDFNFPDKNGNPYKDSDGKMIPSELGEIPEKWRCEGLTEHLDVMGGGTPKTSVSEFWNGEFGFFTPKDASSDFYCLSTEKRVTQAGIDSSSTKLFPENTIFVTARGTVGKTALALIPMAMNQSCYALKEKNGYNFTGFLLLKETIHKLKKYASGGVFDAITTNTLAGTLMAYPSEDFVEGFEKVITPLFSKIGGNTKQIQTLTQFRDTLLPKLMKGEIRVPVVS